MSDRSEVEVFSLLKDNFAFCAEACEKLANHPYRGFLYLEFVKKLREIEGCCIQATDHREDSRWLVIGNIMADVHRRAGYWLRTSPTIETRAEVDKRFKKLADNLRKFALLAEDYRTKATGRVGQILPVPLEGPHRDTRPVQVTLPSGIIVPSGLRLH